MPQDHYDVAVLGLGGLGSATCLELADRGVKVVGFDQFDIPHERGSSGGQTRLIRCAHYDNEAYVAHLGRSLERWSDLAARRGEDEWLKRTGILYAGPSGGALIESMRRARGLDDRPCVALRGDQLAEHGPFELPETLEVLFEPRAGYIEPDRVIEAQAQEAVHLGAVLRTRTEVLELRRKPDSVELVTSEGNVTTDRAVVCAGPWVTGLLRDLGIELRLSRQVVGWVRPSEAGPFSDDRFCCWCIEDPELDQKASTRPDTPIGSDFYYGTPALPGTAAIKVSLHHAGRATALRDLPTRKRPHGRAQRPAEPERATFQPALDRFLPTAATAPLARLSACYYTYSPDEQPILGVHPQDDRVLLAAGMSAQGFKFSASFGESLAALAVGEEPTLDIGFLSPSRFR